MTQPASPRFNLRGEPLVTLTRGNKVVDSPKDYPQIELCQFGTKVSCVVRRDGGSLEEALVELVDGSRTEVIWHSVNKDIDEALCLTLKSKLSAEDGKLWELISGICQ